MLFQEGKSRRLARSSTHHHSIEIEFHGDSGWWEEKTKKIPGAIEKREKSRLQFD